MTSSPQHISARGPADRATARCADPAELRQLYLEERLTVKAIAALLSVSRSQVAAGLKAAGVPWRSSQKQCPVEKDQLCALVEAGAGPTMLARRYGVARNTAARWLADAGLLDPDPEIDPEQLQRLYVGQQLSTREVATELGVNKSRVLRALAAAGIPARPREEKRPRKPPIHDRSDLVVQFHPPGTPAGPA